MGISYHYGPDLAYLAHPLGGIDTYQESVRRGLSFDTFPAGADAVKPLHQKVTCWQGCS
jgi:hypothetical protein